MVSMQTMIALEVGTLSYVPLRYLIDGDTLWELFGNDSGEHNTDDRIREELLLGSRYHWGL